MSKITKIYYFNTFSNKKYFEKQPQLQFTPNSTLICF